MGTWKRQTAIFHFSKLSPVFTQPAGDPPPPPLPVTVKPLGEQPDEGRDPPRLDENLIAVERLAVAGRTDADQMVPAANQRLALPRLHFPRHRVDPLQENGVRANRDYPKQVASQA